jgi:hypothetical protein
MTDSPFSDTPDPVVCDNQRACIICHDPIVDFGHNPHPIADPPFRCCGTCNDLVVMIRLSQRLDDNKDNITRTINTLRDHIYNTANACNCNFHTID